MTDVGEAAPRLADVAPTRRAEASVAPILEAVEAIYRRSLATAIPANTLNARLP